MDLQRLARYGLPAAAALCVLLLLVPLLLRITFDAPITPGPSSYAALRQSDLLLSGSWGKDPVAGTSFVPTPAVMLLALFGLIGVPWLLPILLALALLTLLWLLLPKIAGTSPLVTALALLLVVISPTLSVLGTTHGPQLLCLVLLALALLVRERSMVGCAAALMLALATSPLLAIPVALALLALAVRKDASTDMAMLFAAIVLACAYHALWSPLPDLSRLAPHAGASLFELGGRDGISIFLLLLAGYGLIVIRERNAPLAAALALLSLTLVLPQLLPLALVALCVAAAHGIARLISRAWELELLRQLLVVLVCCICLFLALVSVRDRVDEQPSAQFAGTMVYVANQHREGAVLTDPSYAPMITYFSGRRATLTEDSDPTLMRKLLYSRTSATVYDALEQSGTGYILVTDEMRTRLFSDSEEGILFLLPNTGRFVLIRKSGEYELWYYIKR
jgi:hypothetical protein